MKKARLILDSGKIFEGESFGATLPAAGEVVFNTAMTGYPESLTDPSYAGQIMVLTYPLVGNYGVPSTEKNTEGIPLHMESGRIYPAGLVVADYSEKYSHWNANESLSDWLEREGVAGITGIDTRELTKELREHGVITGKIEIEGEESPADAVYEGINWVERVSCSEPIRYNSGKGLPRVVLVDCGVKANIIRCLINRGVEVIRVPWDYDFNTLEYDGLFISNGPGNPDECPQAVVNIRKAMENPKLPIFGICMGNQLLAKAAGAKIYKLKYGHRSHNQPVIQNGTQRCFITSQNHGYAVDATTLGEGWEPLFTNLNDNTNEGIRHKSNPWFSAQFHPEAASGPTDTEFLFDEFIKLLPKK
ncbi:MAG: glutamine-hydrolyzing carbamoyl-phosphate synthase small subunit [Clostridium sp.]|nr:glutamine-hydrolyzing carbamoyl-phosphate synthase small subunit [Prevotella sp.]MCM1429192.1 glutamine-hydrolyzing carbamoyl-phosphate synthase small subunit [Clostridium sp.]MCM1475834.1 glutamine-hydrolyzing carbamoyl-phosphate synthase small subunit [Muribaculaceae bacterium]